MNCDLLSTQITYHLQGPMLSIEINLPYTIQELCVGQSSLSAFSSASNLDFR